MQLLKGPVFAHRERFKLQREIVRVFREGFCFRGLHFIIVHRECFGGKFLKAANSSQVFDGKDI